MIYKCDHVICSKGSPTGLLATNIQYKYVFLFPAPQESLEPTEVLFNLQKRHSGSGEYKRPKQRRRQQQQQQTNKQTNKQTSKQPNKQTTKQTKRVVWCPGIVFGLFSWCFRPSFFPATNIHLIQYQPEGPHKGKCVWRGDGGNWELVGV